MHTNVEKKLSIISLSLYAIRVRTLFSFVRWSNDLLPKQKNSKFNHFFTNEIQIIICDVPHDVDHSEMTMHVHL